MTIILFVHGTGVRKDRCRKFAAEIRKGLQKAAPESAIEVRSCYWGDLGAAHLDGMSSVPRRGTPVPAEEADDKALRLWELVYEDPQGEFEPAPAADKFAPRSWSAETGNGDSKSDRHWQQLSTKVKHLSSDQGIERAVAEFFDHDARALDDFGTAAVRIASSSRVEACLGPVGELKGDEAAMLARAIVGEFVHELRTRAADGTGSADSTHDTAAAQLDLLPLSAEQRDELATLILAALDLQDLGWGSTLIRASMKPVMWGAAPWLRRHRAGTTEAIGPAAGDILLYQARGDAIRDRLRDAILGCAEPVVLIGHSLGGIIAVDLLADCAKTAARVPVLITVGSQAPYLYEINALRSLPFGERLPEHFPERWVNFWDPRDLLSYLAEAVFAQRGGRDAGKRVEDVRVNTREPFHWSHSAYFKRRALFERLADEIRAVAADGAR